MAEYPPRKTDESARAYDAFTAYARLGAQRSFERLSQTYPKSVPLFKRWSAQHEWVSRAKVFDTALSREAAAATTAAYLGELEAYRQRYQAVGKALYSVAAKLLQRLNEYVERGDLELNASTLTIVARAVLVAADLEAHALQLDRLLPMLESDEGDE
jgi:hypothetical protein